MEKLLKQKCKHVPDRITENGLTIGYKCLNCGKEFCSFKRKTAIWVAKYMILNSQGNGMTNFFFGKIESFLKWSVYFFGASYTAEKLIPTLPFVGDFEIPMWVAIFFLAIPIINIITDPLTGYILKKWGFFAEMARYSGYDKEMNPIGRETLDNTRTIIKELKK